MPARFLSPSQAAHLRNVARRYRNHVKLGKSWKKRTEDELWRKVLSQIVVVGRAEPGYRLEHDPRIGRQVSIKRLKKCQSEPTLQKYLHRFLRRIEARYVGRSWKTDKKTLAAVQNFHVLTLAGGPRRFFRVVARLPEESARIKFLHDHLRYYGKKGARDTLIELRLAQDCMALDARIAGLLRKLRVRIKGSIDRNYEPIERELIRKVAKPLRISGARLDRILFQNYDRIRAEL